MTDEKLHQSAADELYTAIRTVRSIAPLTETYENLSIDDAYQISLSFLNRRLADGEKVVGKKIGVTSAPVMNMLGVDQPDFGFLTDAMWVQFLFLLTLRSSAHLHQTTVLAAAR